VASVFIIYKVGEADHVVDLNKQETLVHDRHGVLKLAFEGPQLANHDKHCFRGVDEAHKLESGVQLLKVNTSQAEESFATKIHEREPEKVCLKSSLSEIGPDKLVLVPRSCHCVCSHVSCFVFIASINFLTLGDDFFRFGGVFFGLGGDFLRLGGDFLRLGDSFFRLGDDLIRIWLLKLRDR